MRRSRPERGCTSKNIQLRSETVEIIETYDVLQMHGFTEFPGFRVDRELAHGFSGGPVFYENRLVGLFSGPDYVSALWPLLIHDYPARAENAHVDLLHPQRIMKPLTTRRFDELFASGNITAVDYHQLQGRVSRVSCAEALKATTIAGRCDKTHIVLSA
jgi:hypothetical protein